jgi:hypothetical protein
MKYTEYLNILQVKFKYTVPIIIFDQYTMSNTTHWIIYKIPL